MKKTLHSVIKYSIWALIFAGATYTYAVGTYTEPPCNPTECNTDEPVNLGDTIQTKVGQFWADGGIGTIASGYFGTSLAVATTANPVDAGLLALFDGAVGASSFCDTNGANCSTAAEIATVVSGGGASSGKTMFLIPGTAAQNDYYRRGGLYTCPSSCAGSLDVSGSFTMTQLTSNIPEIAAETENVAAILVKPEITFAANSLLSTKYFTAYVLDTSINEVRHSDTYHYNEIDAGIYSDGTVLLTKSGNNFNYKCSLTRTDALAFNSSSNFYCYLDVVGYITN